MDKRLKELIIRHWEIAYKKIEEVVYNKTPNWLVSSPSQYLSLTGLCMPTPLGDERGMFKHYNTICETLENLLAGEKVPLSVHFNGAPLDIQNLLNKP